MSMLKSLNIDFFRAIQNDFKNNFPFLFFVFVLVTIPLSLFVNSLFLFLFFISSIFHFETEQVFKKNLLWIPLVLYLLMVFSYLWSIDKSLTMNALSKEFPLLVLQISFLMLNNFLIFKKNKIL